MKTQRTLLKNVRWNEARLLNVVNQRGCYQHNIRNDSLKIEGGKFVKEFSQSHDIQEIDGKNFWCLPGAIDTQVHLREPGLTHKETIETGSMSALRGGTTSYFEMPNTQPPTDHVDALLHKIEIAGSTSWADFAFYGGATPQNAEVLSAMENTPGCCGIKVFMGSSTGNLLVEQIEHLKKVLTSTQKRVALHCEDEDRLKSRKEILNHTLSPSAKLHPLWRDEETAYLATQKVLNLARQLNRQVHILHVTTSQEVELLKLYADVSTFELLPQHLHFTAPECYEIHGTLAQMNPPIRSRFHRDALLDAVKSGWVTVMGSDHAPHTFAEKQKPYPQSPSGITGAQYFYRSILSLALSGKFSLQRALELTCYEPSRLFGIEGKGFIEPGCDADFILFDDQTHTELTRETGFSQSPDSIWRAITLAGRIHQVYKHGELVFCEPSQTFRKPSVVKALTFKPMSLVDTFSASDLP